MHAAPQRLLKLVRNYYYQITIQTQSPLFFKVFPFLFKD